MAAPAYAESEVAPVNRWFGQGRWQAALLILTAIIGFISWSPRKGDFAGYLLVGRAVLDGADIYRATPPGINTWPPFFSLICVPLALIAKVSVYLATSLWLLLNFACVIVVLGLVARVIHDRRMTLGLQGKPELSITSALLLVPLLLTSTYLFNNFEHVQINVILLALTFGGLYLMQEGRTWPGAIALGLAAAMKVMPVVILPYLAFRRQWRAFIAASAATALFSLSPILVFGWGRFWQYVASWRRVLGWGWGVGAYNQSLYAMWDRLIGHHVYPFAPGDNYNLVKSGNPLVPVAFGLTLLLIGAITLRQFSRSAPASKLTTAAEWSAMLILTTLWGPVAWKLYFVVLLVPNALLFAVWRRNPQARRTIGLFLFGSAFLALFTGHDLVGAALSAQLELGSIATISVLVALAGVLWLRGRPDLLTEGQEEGGKLA